MRKDREEMYLASTTNIFYLITVSNLKFILVGVFFPYHISMYKQYQIRLYQLYSIVTVSVFLYFNLKYSVGLYLSNNFVVLFILLLFFPSFCFT